ncbi:MAG TPA: hypothetical protein VH591_10940 [Ktedonobacterales bacterium]
MDIDPALHLHPSQLELTPAQAAEATRFAQERVVSQLSTEPVEESEAERLLLQAYIVAHLQPPTRILWVDGPLQLVQVVAQHMRERAWANVWDNMWASCVRECQKSTTGERAWTSLAERSPGETRLGSLGQSVNESMRAIVEQSVWTNVWFSMYRSVREHVQEHMGDRKGRLWARVRAGVLFSVRAYEDARMLAYYRFFDVYLAPNALHALACFNELVSGYWLASNDAVIVRRPRVLARDADGRLHSATGKCVEYHDGWGFYAWHGVRVPERVIHAPETLTREDFLGEKDVEVRRVIQERMGDRFVTALGGHAIDTEPRGTLYEVYLPEDDPEGVARYVQLQEASTARQNFLRVPPTIQTAAEAVAWSVRLTGEAYRPARKTRM